MRPIQLLLLGLAGLGAEHSAPHGGEDTVHTSHWAEVYSSDSTDYREPVVEESQYPVVESASRSDWFESYPYQRFEERQEEGPGLLESIGQSVVSSVGEVRSKVAGVGEGVVNGALRLVGAETLREKQERAREGYVYHGTHLRGPGYRPEGEARGTRLQEDSGQPRPQGKPIHERLRQGLQGVLAPITNPFNNLLKPRPRGKQPVHRRQQGLPDPITGLKDFGSHVAGGFSKLTGLGRGASAKVSSALFPWLAGHGTPARPALPTLPPVYVPATPEQLAEDSRLLVHRVPAPPLPIYVPAGPPPGPPQHAALPLPPRPTHPARRPTHPPPRPFPFSVPPLIRRVFSVPPPRPPHAPDQRPSGSSRALHRARPVLAEPLPRHLGGRDRVMFYLPSPDLSGGGEPGAVAASRRDEELEVVYSEEAALPGRYITRTIEHYVRPAVAGGGTNIEIDLSGGDSPDSDAWESARRLEAALREQMAEEAAEVRALDRGDTIQLAPTDTLVFDLSQGWGLSQGLSQGWGLLEEPGPGSTP